MKRMFGLVSLFALALAALAPPAVAQVMVVRKAKPWLGVLLIEPAPGQVEVQEVLAGSPAEKAGLKAGDRILALGEAPVGGLDAFIEAVLAKAPGTKLGFRIQRGAETLALEVTLESDPAQAAPFRPLAPPQPARAPEGGIIIHEKPKAWLGMAIGEREDGLVQVQEVTPGSPAEKGDLRVGDCILALSGKPMASVEVLIEEVMARSPGTKLEVRILRGEEKHNLEVVLGVDPAWVRAQAPLRYVRPSEPTQRPEQPRIIRTAPGATLRPAPRSEPLSAADFEAALKRAADQGKPILLGFGAPWSDPSRLLVEESKKPELSGVLKGFLVVHVDVEAHPGLADRFRVDTIPHLEVLTPGGKSVGKILGLLPTPDLARRLKGLRDRALSPAAGTAEATPRPRREGEARPGQDRTEQEVLEELRRIRKLLEEIREALRP